MTDKLVTIDTAKQGAWMGNALRAAAPLGLAAGGAMLGNELGGAEAPDMGMENYDAMTQGHVGALQDASGAYADTVPGYDEAQYRLGDLQNSHQEALARHHAMSQANPMSALNQGANNTPTAGPNLAGDPSQAAAAQWSQDDAVNDVMNIQGVIPSAEADMDQASEALRAANAGKAQAQQTLTQHLNNPPAPATPGPMQAGLGGPGMGAALGAGAGYMGGRAMTQKRASHDEYVTKEAGELTDLFKKTDGDDDSMDKKDSPCKKASHMGAVSQELKESDSAQYAERRPVY